MSARTERSLAAAKARKERAAANKSARAEGGETAANEGFGCSKCRYSSGGCLACNPEKKSAGSLRNKLSRPLKLQRHVGKFLNRLSSVHFSRLHDQYVG